jgi:glycosyltransferase involved in cell wall biosynthesis
MRTNLLELARLSYRNIASRVDSWQRHQFRLKFINRPSANPTVYFLAPDYDIPAGGIMVLYRHVDLLNAGGIRARILHHRPGFRVTWFENATPIVDLASVVMEIGDLLVISELDIDLLLHIPSAVRYVIFNQNTHFTWRRTSSMASYYYSTRSGLVAVVTVSAHNCEMLEYAFPGLEVQRVHLGIDPAKFHPGEGIRGHVIGYMPRRGHVESAQVIEVLRSRGILGKWQLMPMEGLRLEEVADHMRKTSIFMAFTAQEGFGLPSAEAMACGNYVIGNHGFGGREFFRSEFSAAIDAGDVLGFARAVVNAVENEEANPGWCLKRGRQAALFIHSTYSIDAERNDVVGLYGKLQKLAASECHDEPLDTAY